MRQFFFAYPMNGWYSLYVHEQKETTHNLIKTFSTSETYYQPINIYKYAQYHHKRNENRIHMVIIA